MELLAGVALFLIFIFLLISTIVAVGIFVALYKLVEKLVQYDIKTGLSSNEELPSMDQYTPESADTTVPIDQFVPKPNVKIVHKEKFDERDKITPLDN